MTTAFAFALALIGILAARNALLSQRNTRLTEALAVERTNTRHYADCYSAMLTARGRDARRMIRLDADELPRKEDS